MRKEIIITAVLTAIILTLLVALTSATVTEVNTVKYGIIEPNSSLTTTNTLITNSNILGYICSANDCSSVSGDLFTNPTNIPSSLITLTYPTSLQGSGYGLFFYKDSYIPYEVKITSSGSGNAPAASDYLTRKRICNSSITNFTVSNSNGNVTINTIVNSPINSAGPLNYVPSLISNQYSASVQLDVEVTGAQTLSSVKSFNIPYSGTANSAFSFAASPGNYTITATSSVTDAKCISSTPITKTTTLNIPSPPVITCSANLDCGTDYFTSEFYCFNNSIVRDKVIVTCNNPGTTSSYCSNQPKMKISQVCSSGFTCINSTCVQNPPNLIDLSISNGFTEPSQLYTNTTNPALRFHTNNTGNVSLNVPVKIFLDGNNITTFPTLPFAPGYNLWGIDGTGISGVLTQGSHNLTIITDPNNQIPESNENNNIFTFSYNVLASNQNNQTNQTIICSADSDCGWNTPGGFFCSNNSVSQTQTTFTCHSPGTAWSYCSNSTSTTIVNTCSSNQLCSNGICLNLTCSKDSDCNDNNSTTLDQCINPASPSSYCRHTPINCASNLDCGTTGFVGGNFCSNNSVFRNFQNSTCHSPGTALSFCTKDVTPNLVLACSQNLTCSNGSCISNQTNSTNQTGSFLYGVMITRPLQDEVFNYDSGLPLEYIINGSASSCYYNLDDGSNTTITGCGSVSFDTTDGDHTISVFVSNSTVTFSDSKSFSVSVSNSTNNNGGGGSSSGGGNTTSYYIPSNYNPQVRVTSSGSAQNRTIALNSAIPQAKKDLFSNNLFLGLGIALIIILIILIVALFAIMNKRR